MEGREATHYPSVLHLHSDLSARSAEGVKVAAVAMVEAAHVQFRFDSPVTRAYHRIAERLGKAVVVVARIPLLIGAE